MYAMNEVLKAVAGSLPALWGALGVLLGYAFKWVSDEAANKRQSERERAARREARLDAVLERRSEFQRENLLALQEACSRLMRTTGQIDHHDQMVFKATKTWGRTLLPEELDEQSRLNMADTMIRMVRARDDELRALTDRFRSACALVGSKDQAQSEWGMAKSANLYPELMELIGKLLRTLDDQVLAEAERQA